MKEIQLLKFSLGNAKLQKGEAIFDLPAGHSCLWAKECFAFSDRFTGKITDGPLQKFRCYAASCEARATNVRNSRWHNLELIKGKSRRELKELILMSMPHVLMYRIHSSGDFINLGYFDAWLDVARKYPNRTFYCYSKAIPFYLKRKKTIPKNFIFTASYGGKCDSLIAENKLKYCKVVSSAQEAKDLKLPIDKDDSHAWKNNKSFSILLHGVGKAGSLQALLQNQKAWASRREQSATAQQN